MKIRIQWLAFFILARVSQIMSEETFMSCYGYSEEDISFTFDCKVLKERTLHRDYFEKNIVNDTCVIQRSMMRKNFSSASRLELENCRIPIMPHNFLQRFGHVRRVHLSGSSIKVINNETFPDGCTWEELHMSSNHITALPGFLFSQTPNISTIDFSSNMISNIDPNTFKGTRKTVKNIYLSFNHIETMDKLLFSDLKNLEILDLGHNFIEHFQIDLSDARDLTELRVDNNKILRLDCTNFDLSTHKISFAVNANHIQEIDLNCDVDMESMDLIIDDNQLTSLTLPKSKLLKGLRTMQAGRNLIESVTFQQDFYQLEILLLMNNNLKEFSGFEGTMLPKLSLLDITGNQFNCSYLSTFLKKLPKTIHLLSLRDGFEMYGKASKKVYGVECVDEVEKVFQSDRSDNILLAFLTFAVVLLLCMKIFKIINRFRRNRSKAADRNLIYRRNDHIAMTE